MKQIVRACMILALGMGYGTLAFAHAHLKSAEPAQNTAAASPAALTLHFTEGLEPALSGIEVIKEDHTKVSLEEARTISGDDRSLVVPLSEPLAPGVYTVNWHVLAKDGHKSKGTYTFTVTP